MSLVLEFIVEFMWVNSMFFMTPSCPASVKDAFRVFVYIVFWLKKTLPPHSLGGFAETINLYIYI